MKEGLSRSKLLKTLETLLEMAHPQLQLEVHSYSSVCKYQQVWFMCYKKLDFLIFMHSVHSRQTELD